MLNVLHRAGVYIFPLVTPPRPPHTQKNMRFTQGKERIKKEFVLYLLVLAHTGNYAKPLWGKILYFSLKLKGKKESIGNRKGGRGKEKVA